MTVPPGDSKGSLESTGIESSEHDRRSRTREKEERVASEAALKKLATQLAGLRAEQLENLGLPEAVISVLQDYARIKSPAARARHLRFMRSQLRDLDWYHLQRQVEQIKAGNDASLASQGEVADWGTRLALDSDEGLSQFLREYPEADRGRLRQLIRNVQKVPDAKRQKARRQLEAVVEATISEHREKP